MQFVNTVSNTSRPVVVFGASIIGKIILDALHVLKIKPVFFCDNDPQKQTATFHGYKVVTFDRLLAEAPNALVIVAAGRYYSEIKQQLLTAGFNDIYNDAEVIKCIDFDKVPFEEIESIVWYLPKIGLLPTIMDLPEDSLLLPRLNVVVTTRCNLKCKHCSSLIGHYKQTNDMDTTRILSSIDRFFSSVDLVYHVELLGGEPFLNKDLAIIAEHLLATNKILHLDVITNGTLVPNDKCLKALQDKRVSVVIDDYGDLSTKLDSLAATLAKANINHRIHKHWAWADLGDFDSRGLNEKQLIDLFEKCNFNSCSELLDGKLYRCPRSSHGTNTGLVPDYPDDYLVVLDESLGRKGLREKIKFFFNEKTFIKACDHCNGNTGESLTLTPAEQ